MVGPEELCVRDYDLKELFRGGAGEIPEELLERDINSFCFSPSSATITLAEPPDLWDKFVDMAEQYKAYGVRFVVFDNPEDVDGSWYMPFYTHGQSADELPIERFDTPYMRDWMRFYGYDGPVSAVSHFDTTDDLEEILVGYDYRVPIRVNQLA